MTSDQRPATSPRDTPAAAIGRRGGQRYAQLDPGDPGRVIIRRGPRDDSGAIAVPTAQLRALLRAYDALRDAQHLLARAEALSGDPRSGDPPRVNNYSTSTNPPSGDPLAPST